MQTPASTACARARVLLPAALAFWLAAQHASAEPTAGVISYPPAFFAAQQPANASEMLARIPGFALDNGAAVRGFEGAGGNVLVDGQRPASKTESIDAILGRIPASQVERIDIVRGGAPGIDMQGKAMIANVILRKGRGTHAQLEANASQLPDGRTVGDLEWQASGGFRDHAWEASGLFAKGHSSLLGQGAGLEAPPAGPA